MSKYVVLSFDDARKDTFVNAFPIIKKYGLKATINVVTDFVEHEEKYTCFGSAMNRSMTYKELRECQEYGFEIACHGHTHKNTTEDILENIQHLKDGGVFDGEIGFASPNSYLTENNGSEILKLVREGELAYVRGGTQVKREGLLYALIYKFNECIKSKKIFWALNQSSFFYRNRVPCIYPSIGISSKNTVAQLENLIHAMPDESGVILMFHSILKKGDEGREKDKWWWDADDFDAFCSWLQRCGVKVVNIKDGIMKPIVR